MAVTFTVPELAAALRLNDSAEETAEVTRFLAYVSVAVVKHAPNAPDVTHNEAARRLAGYIFDQPEAARGDAYANAMRNSGAARMLLPYRVHRLGLPDAVEAAQQAVGTVGNPVTNLAIEAGQLVVTFADGTTDALDLPDGMGDGTDQVARDSASSAQGAAENAQTDIDDHEANHPSGLPVGTSQRRELKWNPNASVWDAVSDVQTVYYGAAALGDFSHVASALAAGLNTAGTRIATTSYMLYKGFGANVLRDDHLTALWAAISTSPVVFVLAPAHTDWINNFGLTVRTGPLDATVTDDFVYINGTAYDIKLATYPGVEADVGSAQWRYTTPAAVYTISQTAA